MQISNFKMMGREAGVWGEKVGQITAHSGQLTAEGATASQLQIADWKIERLLRKRRP